MVSSYNFVFLPVSIVLIVIFLLYSLPQQNIFQNTDDGAKSKSFHSDILKAHNVTGKSKSFHSDISKAHSNSKSKSSGISRSKFETRNEGIRKEFQASLATIQTACEKYKSQNSTKKYKLPDMKNFSLEPRHKLLICRTAKHGSTSWANNLVQIYQQ